MKFMFRSGAVSAAAWLAFAAPVSAQSVKARGAARARTIPPDRCGKGGTSSVKRGWSGMKTLSLLHRNI